MINRSLSRLAGLLSLAGLIFSGARLPAQSRPVPDLTVIRAAYVDSLTSIRTAKIDYELTWPRTLPGLTNNPEAQKKFFFQTVTDGNRKAVRITRTWHNGVTSQSRAVFDGKQVAMWVGPTKESPHATGHINPPRHPGDFTNWPTVFTLMGEPPRAQWTLAKQLSKEGARVVGWESVNGHECIKVEFPKMPEFENSATPVVETTAWFDPGHGYLPLQFVLEESSDAAAPERYIYAVEKFQGFPATGGRRLWIPSVATVDTRLQTQRIEVTRCLLNEPVSQEDFQPDFPENSQVTEYGDGGSRRSYTVSGAIKVLRKPAPPLPVLNEIPPQGESAVVGSSVEPPLSARPADSTSNYWTIALGVGMGAVVIGYLFRRRNQNM